MLYAAGACPLCSNTGDCLGVSRNVITSPLWSTQDFSTTTLAMFTAVADRPSSTSRRSWRSHALLGKVATIRQTVEMTTLFMTASLAVCPALSGTSSTFKHTPQDTHGQLDHFGRAHCANGKMKAVYPPTAHTGIGATIHTTNS